ncbi:hypothetical protein [Dielma fastidiosa]|uniref:hypothetical protein n=1 Tax=Dielma fastidiosa TaxID=1034346 RepID=UPI000E4962C6|nr:hypothetical protein [Dielma fastidiosa]RHN00151.1 hypothetical protein DWZ33_10185 [Dielma fastidiosa]
MSIGFSFETSVHDKKQVKQILSELCKERELGYDEDENNSGIHFCPLGNLYVEFIQDGDEWIFKGDCQTNLVGAGFHKYAIEFIDAFQERLGKHMLIEDDTEYEGRRDFERMRKEHFYSWLQNIIEICHDYAGGDYSNLSICWDMNQYQPAGCEGCVLSPFGRFNIKELVSRVAQEGIGSFAQEFFIWNNEEQDAYFYRNCAMHLMWEKCYYMPSSRSDEDAILNTSILDYLERAMTMSHEIPIPIKDYEYLCRLDERTPMDTSKQTVYYSETPIGYRKGWVTIHFGKIDIDMPGNFRYEREADGNNLWYDGAYPDWKNMRVSGYLMNEGDADFVGPVFGEGSEPYTEIICGEGRCRYVIHEAEEDGEKYFMGIGQIICQNGLYLMTLCFNNEEDKPWAEEVFSRIKGKKQEKVEEMTYPEEKKPEILN